MFLDVFSELKSDKNKSYIVLDDFQQACLRYKPQCLKDFLDESDPAALAQCCD